MIKKRQVGWIVLFILGWTIGEIIIIQLKGGY